MTNASDRSITAYIALNLRAKIDTYILPSPGDFLTWLNREPEA